MSIDNAKYHVGRSKQAKTVEEQVVELLKAVEDLIEAVEKLRRDTRA